MQGSSIRRLSYFQTQANQGQISGSKPTSGSPTRRGSRTRSAADMNHGDRRAGSRLLTTASLSLRCSATGYPRDATGNDLTDRSSVKHLHDPVGSRGNRWIMCHKHKGKPVFRAEAFKEIQNSSP